MTASFSLNALRFEDIRAIIVSYFQENGIYKAEYDFEGSNFSYQIDLVAYMTMMLSYQNAQKSNNIFIDTTEIRKNAVSIVKTMGYKPKRKISSRFTGTMEYIASDGESFVSGDTITIPARTLFTSAPNGYDYLNLSSITLTYQNILLLSTDFTLYEGTFKELSYFGTGGEVQTLIINSEMVEENNLNIYLRSNNTDSSNNVKWTYAPSFFSTTETKIYFIEEDFVDEKKPKIIFGDGTLGQIPTNTELITIEYLETLGVDTNGETGLSFTDSSPTIIPISISGFSYTFENLSIEIPSLLTSFGGKDYETLTEIQFNAPRFYSSGGNGVSGPDFNTLLANYESIMKYSNVTGGPVLFPNEIDTEKGNIYFVGVPASLDEDDFINNAKIYLFEIEENSIIPNLKDNTVISTIKKFVKPTYIYLEMAPTIEIPSNFSVNEIQTTVTNGNTALIAYRDDNLKGLGKSYRHTKALSALTNTSGVIAAEIDLVINFIINRDSFYSSKKTRMNLPVVFTKDATGLVLLDENNNPVTTNFIKKRSDIITKANETAAVPYTQFTFPINQSSIYGPLFHKNTDREIYNIDVVEKEFITFQMLGTVGNKILNFQNFEFKDQNDVTYVANLSETPNTTSPGTGLHWWIQLNGHNIGKLQQDDSDEDLFTITAEDTNYLSGTIGAIPAVDEVNYLNVDKKTETDANGTITYYSLNLLLTNEVFTDVRLYGYNKLIDATFDASTFKWTWTNNRVLKSNDITPVDVTLEDNDSSTLEESFIKIVHDDSTSDIIFSMKHFNGDYSLNNYMNDVMNQYDYRNDLTLITNYTLSQESNVYTYQLSNFSAIDSSYVQTIALNAYETTKVTTIGNAGGILDGTWFYLYSANDTNPYYVWFNGTGSTPDPTPFSPATGIEVNIAEDQSAGTVANLLKIKIDSESDFGVTVGTGLTADEVTITNAAFGQTTNTSDGDTSGEETLFTFETLIPGTINSDPISNLVVGDLVKIQSNDSAGNNGYFQIKTVNTNDIEIYNFNGVIDISGTGTITHYESSGTYGSYTIYGYDIYHDISIGTLNYSTGVLEYKQNIKGFTDLVNEKIIVENIKDIFNNYGETIDGIVTEMDEIKISSIDNNTATNVFVGPLYDFDPQFNQCIQTKIELPVIKI